MTIKQPKYNKEEFAKRGNEIYTAKIRPQVEPANNGKIVAIDIETGAFEVAEDIVKASEQLLGKYPDAQTWFIRISHPAVYHFGASRLKSLTSTVQKQFL